MRAASPRGDWQLRDRGGKERIPPEYCSMSRISYSKINSSERLRSFPPKVRNKTRMSPLTTSVHAVLEISSQGNSKLAGCKVKLPVSLLANDMILYIASPKKSMEKIIITNKEVQQG